MEVDRYISVKELKRQLNAWNMGFELPRWILRAIDETPSTKVSIVEEGATNGDVIKAIFPNTIFSGSTKDTISQAFIRPNGSVVINDYFDNWLNARYKKESEGAKE